MTQRQSADSVGIVQPQTFTYEQPFGLQCGVELAGFELVYETYGTLNEGRSNAILICHALSGNHHAAGFHAQSDAKPGWWDTCIGPGKPIDTDRFFVVCPNNLGGCHGSTGPLTVDPASGATFGADFPAVVVEDWVRSQALLADHLGVERFAAIIGGSLGGMQAMQWAIDFPARVHCAVVIAAAAKLSAQNIAFNEIARQAIEADPDFVGGRYVESGRTPDSGLGLARMIGHVTYLSDYGMGERFGRELKSGDIGRAADVEFQVESYLHHQGQAFSQRFDANTYVLMTKALDYFDPARAYDDDLVQALRGATAKFLIISFTSDWRFSVTRSKEIVDALVAAGKNVAAAVIESPHGHDSFLLPIPRYIDVLGTYLRQLHDEVTAMTLRPDLKIIADLVNENARVLDLGCGEGDLLAYLQANKNVNGYGLDVDADNICICLGKGVNVIEQDLDEGLANFGDDSFNMVVMTETLQSVRRPDRLLEEMLRIGEECIVTFPNFGHWRCRLQLITSGRMPVAKHIPHNWFDTPNIHLCTFADFEHLCGDLGLRIIQRRVVDHNHRERPWGNLLPNLLGPVAFYRLGRGA